MKKKFLLTFCMILQSLFGFSQSLHDLIDPVFYLAAEKNIHYPMGAIRGSVYGRIYTAFQVDASGKIRNVRIVYPILSEKVSEILGFEWEIKNGLKKTPVLAQAKAGNYLVPIAFEYENVHYGTHDIPTNRLPNDFDMKDYQFLREIHIKARSDAYRMLRNYSNIPPPSQQLAEEFN